MLNEDLGIVVKLYEYFTYHNIHVVKIEHYDSISFMLKQYMPNLQFSSGGINVNIRNNKRKGLIIQNIHNCEKKINAKEIYLIPWSNMENPLIMYFRNKKYKISKTKILRSFYNLSYEQYNKMYETFFPQFEPVIQLPAEIPTESVLTEGKEIGKIKDVVKAISGKISKLNELIT